MGVRRRQAAIGSVKNKMPFDLILYPLPVIRVPRSNHILLQLIVHGQANYVRWLLTSQRPPKPLQFVIFGAKRSPIGYPIDSTLDPLILSSGLISH